MIAFQKQHIFLLNEEVIWQASDSSLSKGLHGKAQIVLESLQIVDQCLKNIYHKY